MFSLGFCRPSRRKQEFGVPFFSVFAGWERMCCQEGGMDLDSLKIKVTEIMQTRATLLWLEGATYNEVVAVKITKQSLILNFRNGITKVFHFDKYAETKVGLQFWHGPKAGVLYRWDCLGQQSSSGTESLPSSG